MYEYRGRVLKTVDGDSAVLMLDLGFKIHLEVEIRLKGINAPEMSSKVSGEHEAAVKSKDFLDALLAQSPLTVKTEKTSRRDESDKQEKYGRYLATITNGAGVDVNAEMVKAGHAVEYAGNGPRPSWPWK